MSVPPLIDASRTLLCNKHISIRLNPGKVCTEVTHQVGNKWMGLALIWVPPFCQVCGLLAALEPTH